MILCTACSPAAPTPWRRRDSRGLTLIEVVIVMVISAIVLAAITWLLVIVARSNTEAMTRVSRMNQSDLPVDTFRRYARDAEAVSLNGNTHLILTRSDGRYDLYYDGNGKLLGITPDSSPDPFVVASDVGAVTFTLPTADSVRMELTLSWDDGDVIERKAEVLCRNVVN